MNYDGGYNLDYQTKMEQKLHVRKYGIIRAAVMLHINRGPTRGRNYITTLGKPALIAHRKKIYRDIFNGLRAVMPTTKARRKVDEFVQSQLDSIEAEAAKNIEDISQSVASDVTDVLMRGVRLGHSVDQIATNLYNNIDEFTRGRAATVARTETHNAAMDALWDAVDALDVPAESKTWVCLMDGRERDSHHDLHGTTVDINDPFQAWGGDLMYPGDDSLDADASEIVNCRCSVIYTTSNDEEVGLDDLGGEGVY